MQTRLAMFLNPRTYEKFKKHELESISKTVNRILKERFKRKKRKYENPQPSFTEQDRKKFFKAINKLNWGNRTNYWKNFFGLMNETGLRVSDAVRIKEKDIIWDYNIIQLTQEKTKSRQTVFLNKKAIKIIKKHLKKYRKKISENQGYLFFKQQPFCATAHLSPNSARNKFFKIRATAALNQVYAITQDGKKRHIYSTHSFRYTKAKKVMDKTKDIRFVQIALGHKKLSSTEIYTHPTFQEKQKVLGVI